MDKEIFNGIEQGMKEAIAYAKGARNGYRVTEISPLSPEDIKAIRKRTKLTQTKFAQRFGFAIDTIRNWETGRRMPDRSAQLLLKVIARNPKVVEEAARA